MKISKRKLQDINLISVFDEIYRDEINPRHWTGSRESNGMCNQPFYVDPPENWSDDEKELYSLMNLIEEKIKTKILEVLAK